MKKKQRIGELFCGPGGLGYAAIKKANCTHAWAIDSNFDSCKTYAKNICGINFDENLPDSIKTSKVEEIEFKKLGPIDGLLFGFPCNDFSIVGERKKLKGKYGGLYKFGVECLKIHQPNWFLAENVSGINSAKDNDVFINIIKELELIGYEVNVHKYKFEEYGIPQKRHRYIIVGFKNKLKLKFKPPAETHLKKNEYITVEQALDKYPEYEISKNATHVERTNHSEIVKKRLEATKPGENAWNANIPKEFQLTGVKGAKLSQIYKKLKGDEPSYTITGSGGGGTHVYHWKEHRALTNREKAILQTFPTSYEFYGGKESVKRQIGMAVPVKGAAIIIKSILKTLEKKSYKISKKPSWTHNKELF
jgi:DNA (cytosine-5)-methyltransferase 1